MSSPRIGLVHTPSNVDFTAKVIARLNGWTRPRTNCMRSNLCYTRGESQVLDGIDGKLHLLQTGPPQPHSKKDFHPLSERFGFTKRLPPCSKMCYTRRKFHCLREVGQILDPPGRTDPRTPKESQNRRWTSTKH
jgi:hypothetical protein